MATPMPPKKISPVAAEVEKSVEEVVTEDVKDVKVLSLRHGEVRLKDGQVLKYRGTVMVSKDIAEWLVDSFKPLMQIV